MLLKLFQRPLKERRSFNEKESENYMTNDIERSKSFQEKLKEASNKRKSLSEVPWKLKNIDFIKTLGEGAFGKVKLATNLITKDLVAVKILKKKKVASVIVKLREEIKALQLLNSPFVVQLYKVIEDDKKIYIIQEYVGGGDLHHILKTKKVFTEQEARFYFTEIYLGLKYIHKYNIMFRDLKPENILIDSKGHIKLCDFGLAKKLDSNEKRTSFCGTLDYMPPEVVRGEKQDVAVDYWSLGCMLYEMVHGHSPFYHSDDETCQKKILNYDWKFETHISKELQDLILLLLEINPKKRLKNVQKIKTHPWLKKMNWKFAETLELIPPYVPGDKEILEDRKASIDPVINLTEFEKKLFKILSDECSIEYGE